MNHYRMLIQFKECENDKILYNILDFFSKAYFGSAFLSLAMEYTNKERGFVEEDCYLTEENRIYLKYLKSFDTKKEIAKSLRLKFPLNSFETKTIKGIHHTVKNKIIKDSVFNYANYLYSINKDWLSFDNKFLLNELIDRRTEMYKSFKKV